MFPGNHLWIYDRLHTGQMGIKQEFYVGVEEFIDVACQSQPFLSEGKVRCPYARCQCLKYLDNETIRYHLYKDGFMHNYWVQTKHGKVAVVGNQFSMGNVGDSFGSGIDMGDRDMGNINWEDNVNRFQEMVLMPLDPNLECAPNLLMRFLS